MITKEERVEILGWLEKIEKMKDNPEPTNRKLVMQIFELKEFQVNAPTYVRQYEDTVTELEGKLNQVIKVLREADKELRRVHSDVEGMAGRNSISRGIQYVGETLVQQLLSQLEKGDKDNDQRTG